MNVNQALAHARTTLTAGGVEEASLESEILLRYLLKINRVQLYLSLDKELSKKQEDTYRELIARRRKGEPSAYITNNREFYGLDFYVDSRVLIPRPETELLVTKALEYAQKRQVETIADIGTGCGNIAICLAIHLPQTTIYAIDVSAKALEVARINCDRHRVNNIKLLQGSFCTCLPGLVDIIVSNMPYVKQSELRLIASAKFEPPLALDGGEDGLQTIFQLCHQVRDKLRPAGCLLLEIGAGQKGAVVSLLQELFPSAKIEVTRDPSNIERVVTLSL